MKFKCQTCNKVLNTVKAAQCREAGHTVQPMNRERVERRG